MGCPGIQLTGWAAVLNASWPVDIISLANTNLNIAAKHIAEYAKYLNQDTDSPHASLVGIPAVSSHAAAALAAASAAESFVDILRKSRQISES